MSDARAQFLAAALTTPASLPVDAIVVFAGEDSAPRAAVAHRLFCSMAPPRMATPELLIVGRRETVAQHECVERVGVRLMTLGLAPSALTYDQTADNTREQAVRLVARAQAQGWKKVILVASAYHIPRALLTCIAALREAGSDLHVEPVAASPLISDSPWAGTPEHAGATRSDLLARELEKCDEYGTDVASFADGLAYLQLWADK